MVPEVASSSLVTHPNNTIILIVRSKVTKPQRTDATRFVMLSSSSASNKMLYVEIKPIEEDIKPRTIRILSNINFTIPYKIKYVVFTQPVF